MMIYLYIGAFIAGFLMPFFGSPMGWYAGIMTGIIQIMILALLGVITKIDLWTIIVGVLMIFLGGIFGGLIAETFGLGGIFQTITILAIQSLFIIFTGFVKGAGKPAIST